MDIDSDEDASPVDCLTGFSAASVAANAVATEESGSLSHLLELFDSSSDEEEVVWDGSRPDRSANVKRDFHGAHVKLSQQCFNGEESLHTRGQFKRRFRVLPAAFEHVHERLVGKATFHRPSRKDATEKQCIHPLVRMTAVFWMLTHGTCADSQDEHLQIGETTVDVACKDFCRLLVKQCGDECLNRTPTLLAGTVSILCGTIVLWLFKDNTKDMLMEGSTPKHQKPLQMIPATSGSLTLDLLLAPSMTSMFSTSPPLLEH